MAATGDLESAKDSHNYSMVCSIVSVVCAIMGAFVLVLFIALTIADY